MALEDTNKKANQIIKAFDVASLTPGEWEWTAFQVQLRAGHSVMENLLHFTHGLDKYYNDKYLGTRYEKEDDDGFFH